MNGSEPIRRRKLSHEVLDRLLSRITGGELAAGQHLPSERDLMSQYQVGRPAVRAPWSEDAALRAAVRRLREQGETVVCILPGHEHEGQEFECDRELVAVGGQWAVRAL